LPFDRNLSSGEQPYWDWQSEEQLAIKRVAGNEERRRVGNKEKSYKSEKSYLSEGRVGNQKEE
jgi:hypothetical protein